MVPIACESKHRNSSSASAKESRELLQPILCFQVQISKHGVSRAEMGSGFPGIGLIAGLRFTGIAGTSIAIAKTLFFIFLVIFLVLLIAGLTMARRV